jgi:anti-anti-sigma factor
MDMKELQQVVNPIYTTAKGTVLMLAGGRDKDAIALLPYLDMGEIQKGSNATPPEIQKCYIIGQKARYELHNKASLESGKPNIVDLPSGYTPRGFRMADAGKKYYGFDLPIVIDAMKPAAEKTMTEEQRALAEYHAVDATNYESMKAALGDVKGELCIVTEGLLGYFSESELISLCQAVHRLLSEYGGCWITADCSILQIYTLTFSTVLKGDAAAFLSRMQGYARNMADVDFLKNSLFLNGIDGAKRFLNEQGFNVKSESVDRYIPDIPGVDGDLMKELREAYKVMEIFTMTVAKKAQKPIDKDLPFAVESSCVDGVFTASVQGRMDTITAPELLKKFQEAGDGIREIKIDVSRMAYVSSAGLRVLLMMYKSLDDKSRFKMTGVSEEVREILETTGFDQFLL